MNNKQLKMPAMNQEHPAQQAFPVAGTAAAGGRSPARGGVFAAFQGKPLPPIIKAMLLALAYLLTGWLGLQLAVPPGYATLVWLPSGLALVCLVTWGWRLWPGVFIGSLLLNGHTSGAFAAAPADWLSELLPVMGIAAGSSLQACVAAWLARRYFAAGNIIQARPLRLLGILIVLGPLSCLIAATIGTASLYYGGALATGQVAETWRTWWFGDSIGVILCLPFLLSFSPRDKVEDTRKRQLRSLPLLAMVAVGTALGLTFYAYKFTSEAAAASGYEQFEAQAAENERALEQRLQSYQQSLTAAAAFVKGNQAFSRAQWRQYVERLDIGRYLPGINGIGFIEQLDASEVAGFQSLMRADGAPDFAVHPEVYPVNYVISYIEPLERNRQALGLNIAFEGNRSRAAAISRDTRQAQITQKIVLVQDQLSTPGFLLLQPVFLDAGNSGADVFAGWVYAPFIGNNLLRDLTRAQNRSFSLSVYDGDVEAGEQLIFASSTREPGAAAPQFRLSRGMQFAGREWLLVWESTPAFEVAQRRNGPLLVLVGGIAVTGLLALFLALLSVRDTETLEWMADERQWLLPLVLFALVMAGTYQLSRAQRAYEQTALASQLQVEAQRVASLVEAYTRDQLNSLRRMGRRWEASPASDWQRDASIYMEHPRDQLKAIERVGADYRVKWALPLEPNRAVIGLDILFDAEREAALEGAATRDSVTLTSPLNLLQGYAGFIAYVPLKIDNAFGGFLAAVYSVEAFFQHAIAAQFPNGVEIALVHGDAVWFRSDTETSSLLPDRAHQQQVTIHDQDWQLQLTPTRQYLARTATATADVIMLTGGFIGALLALAVRSTLLSRLKSRRLAASNQLNAAIVSSTAYLVIATDTDGQVVSFNDAAEQALGYRATEVVGESTPAMWHDPQEVAIRTRELSAELGYELAPGFEVFVAKPIREGVESREWTLVRRDGSTFPAHVTVTPLTGADGQVQGFLGVIADITDQRIAQQALRNSEETFRSAMQSAPIGMALVSTDGRWLKVNPSLCALFGYDEEAMYATDFQSLTHPDDLEDDLELVRQTLSGEIEGYDIEKRYLHRSGRMLWGHLSVALVRDESGQPEYFVSQIQDITEQREMARIKAEFISVVSHELRTPLTSINGALRLMSGTLGESLPAQASELIEIAERNCQQLITIINDTLDLDRITAGRLEVELAPQPVAALLRDAVQRLQSYADSFAVELQLEAVEANLRFVVDPARFLQIMNNLLSNAIKFSEAGGTVTVSGLGLGDSVMVTVQDRGPGIPEEFRHRIFGRFEQADASVTRRKGGTGLGLHISKQLVELMKGSIGFRSETGKGTEFWVTMPRALDNGSEP